MNRTIRMMFAVCVALGAQACTPADNTSTVVGTGGRAGGSGGAQGGGTGGTQGGGTGGSTVSGSGGTTVSGSGGQSAGTGGAAAGTGGAGGGAAGTGGASGGFVGNVACGGTRVCDLSVEVCCSSTPGDSTQWRCAGSCTMSAPRRCDGPEDCPAGSSCCGGDFPPAAVCQATADCGPYFWHHCHSTADCPAIRPYCCPAMAGGTPIDYTGCTDVPAAGCT